MSVFLIRKIDEIAFSKIIWPFELVSMSVPLSLLTFEHASTIFDLISFDKLFFSPTSLHVIIPDNCVAFNLQRSVLYCCNNMALWN